MPLGNTVQCKSPPLPYSSNTHSEAPRCRFCLFKIMDGKRRAHLVLHVRGLLDLGGLADHVDLAHDLLAEEVADLAALPVVDDGEVDGEMGVREAQDLAR